MAGNSAALDSAMLGITQEAVLRNVNRDLEEAARHEDATRERPDATLEHTTQALAEARLGVGDADADADADDVDDDDPALRALEQRRMAEMKNLAAKRAINRGKGHGELTEIVEEEFLAECCKSERVVCHFFHNDFERCKILDKHLRTLATKYESCKFVRINAEKAPFFVAKLGIRTLPTLLVFHNGVCKDRVIGFEELGGEDDFPTRTLEVRLHTAGAIAIKEARAKKKTKAGFRHRGTYSDDDDSDKADDDDDDGDDAR